MKKADQRREERRKRRLERFEIAQARRDARKAGRNKYLKENIGLLKEAAGDVLGSYSLTKNQGTAEAFGASLDKSYQSSDMSMNSKYLLGAGLLVALLMFKK
jgi:hypothetical protein